MKGIAFVKMLGPKHARTPSGEPIQLSSAPFDLGDDPLASARLAIAKVAKQFHKHEIPSAEVLAEHYALEAEYQVVIPPHRVQHTPSWSKLYYFRYTPEDAIRAHKNIPLPNHFDAHSSWFLQKVTKEEVSG